MPIKDDDERRAYFREYMRRRRAERAVVTPDDDYDPEIAPPEVVEDNIHYAIARMNENARAFNKILKISAIDLEAIARINTAIDKMMGKWRSVQSTLERKADRAAPQARIDARIEKANAKALAPVVEGWIAAGKLSDQQIADYRERGIMPPMRLFTACGMAFDGGPDADSSQPVGCAVSGGRIG